MIMGLATISYDEEVKFDFKGLSEESNPFNQYAEI